MHKDWQKTTEDLSALMQDIGKNIPDVAKGFSQMAKGAYSGERDRSLR
ncbi:MAG: Alkylhydroperoxidase [Halomonas sp. 54_146]|nr:MULTISPECIES: hypothetical protein [unclassified Halomonas]KUJ88968.1 MAG: Alkylhydroperoxidase [Halomonas sp. 54_146]